MQTPLDSLQARLFAMQDSAYKDFNKKLIPTVDEKTMIGIRTPVLKQFAKTLFKTEPDLVTAFLGALPHQYFEENNLHAFLIENIKDFDTALAETERFLPFIDNWATCDSFAPPLFKKHPDEMYQKILEWIRSPHTYTVRYAIGLLLSNYLDSQFTPAALELVAGVHSEEYYVNMMIAWYFSFALIKQYDAAIPYIIDRKLAPFTHNKTIQKAIESRRIPAATKDYLRTLKIPS
ncbi:MAG: DNA alkylation repair protein [Treponema sp.]|uniref:DNA alkylation repair protein n=1 Tax=Treponema sp. TaxID=166 RepID=UPI003FA2D238